MTQSKREPFAKVFEYGINVGEIEVYSESDDKEVVAQINAAFNARVDDEVKKAVEEFVARSARKFETVCEDSHGECWPHERCKLATAIRGLLTEPEEK